MFSTKEQCKAGEHYYVYAPNYSSIACKKCGSIIELEEYVNKPDAGYLNNTLYKWNKDIVDASNIASFSLTFGRCPVVNIKFEDNMIISCNYIHSRDSSKTFPKNLFDKKVVELSQKEIKKIYRYLDAIKFERWKNDAHILRNYIEGACGFGVDKTFCCEFNNDMSFCCFNPKGIKYSMMVWYLKKLSKLG